ncbi:DUF3313 family protein [Marinimicrobium sp. ABcell2]|uniref:DUF3313 family protein n=1 Tax=Marinimicrobium sp. ABcell2 TaxID=3069751 RepID=UPI0027AE5947|nr:DUF3313 family protein [Marinimicrobium sp. ABcell2]MDQ2078387.1 DUF3313 family protein [Marinimicrobium sp. ABcell2]
MTIITDFLTRATPKMAAVVLGATLMVGCAQHPHEHLADPNLVPVAKGNFDHVFLAPDTALPRFSNVYIEPAEVRMSDYWLKDRRRDYTQRDLDRIERDYGRLLTEALARGLTADTGVVVTDDPEQADVIFRPVLRSLNLYAPDTAIRPTRQYAREAGNATFDLTLVDARTGQVLGQFIDHRETQGLQRIEKANRATNRRHFRRLMDRWTDNLTDYLLIGGTVPSAG